MALDLKASRQNAKLSRRELAEKVGVTEQYVYYIERGERRPSVDTAKRIADVLTLDWMRFFDTPNDNPAETA